MTHPTNTREWWTAGLAFGVLGLGAVLLSLIGADDALAWYSLLFRAAGAFLLGFVAAGVWWAASWLRDHGYRRDVP